MKKPAAKAPAGKAAAKKKDSDSDDDSDDESEDEAPKRKQSNVSQSKKAPAKKAVENDEDDEEEEQNGNSESGPKELFVGNLAFSTNEDTINDLFSQYGTVTNVKMPQQNGKPKGFAFVEFSTNKEAQAAIDALNG